MREPSLDPYAAKLERFELFSTNQCYYLVGCDKLNTSYRVLKMDRTLIERPKETSGGGGGGPRSSSFASGSAHSSSGAGGGAGHLYHASSANASAHTAASAPAAPDLHLSSSSDSQTAQADNSHTAKPTLRPLADFLTEDPVAYSQEEIKVMLDMIHDGNMLSQPQSQQQQSEMGGGGGGGDRRPGKWRGERAEPGQAGGSSRRRRRRRAEAARQGVRGRGLRAVLGLLLPHAHHEAGQGGEHWRERDLHHQGTHVYVRERGLPERSDRPSDALTIARIVLLHCSSARTPKPSLSSRQSSPSTATRTWLIRRRCS
jgi:hypothetical protein